MPRRGGRSGSTDTRLVDEREASFVRMRKRLLGGRDGSVSARMRLAPTRIRVFDGDRELAWTWAALGLVLSSSDYAQEIVVEKDEEAERDG